MTKHSFFYNWSNECYICSTKEPPQNELDFVPFPIGLLIRTDNKDNKIKVKYCHFCYRELQKGLSLYKEKKYVRY